MAAPDYFYTEGWDKYGEPGVSNLTTNLIMGEWNSISSTQGGISFSLVAALSGTGYALQMSLPNDSSPRMGSLNKNLPGNYQRVVAGITFKWITVTTAQPYGFVYYDNGTAQFSITINPTGTVSLRRGDDDGTIIATSAEAPGIGTTNCITWNVVPHGSAGTATVYLNGVPMTNLDGLTGLDLTNTANNYVNEIRILCDHGGTAGGATTIQLDHHFGDFYLSSATSPDTRPLTGNPVVDTTFPVASVESDFTPIRNTLGDRIRYGSSVASPAANSLILRKFTAVGDGTLTTMRITPNATNAGAKFKGVIYADNGSGTAPAALLASGAEVVGCTSGVVLDSGGMSQAIVDGTTYWVGFIMDTSLSMQLTDSEATGYRAANTYGAGTPPDPAPAMTSGQGSWNIYGLILPPDETWSQLTVAPQSTIAYNSGAAVGLRERWQFQDLSVNPAECYRVSHKVNLRRTDAGSRTIAVITESNGTEEQSSPTAPSTSGTWAVNGEALDPATGLEWTATGVNGSTGGLEIIT